MLQNYLPAAELEVCGDITMTKLEYKTILMLIDKNTHTRDEGYYGSYPEITANGIKQLKLDIKNLFEENLTDDNL